MEKFNRFYKSFPVFKNLKINIEQRFLIWGLCTFSVRVFSRGCENNVCIEGNHENA